jgi:hypothetical protein
MLAASIAVIARRYPEISVGALLGVVVVQGFGYGLIFDVNFFLRNLSVIGGLLMVLSDSLAKKKNIFAGLPSISETDRKVYFQVSVRESERRVHRRERGLAAMRALCSMQHLQAVCLARCLCQLSILSGSLEAHPSSLSSLAACCSSSSSSASSSKATGPLRACSSRCSALARASWWPWASRRAGAPASSCCCSVCST